MIRMETIRIFRVIAIANITSRYHHLKQSNSIASLYIEDRPDTIDDKLTCHLEVFRRIKLRMMGAQGAPAVPPPTEVGGIPAPIALPFSSPFGRVSRFLLVRLKCASPFRDDA